MRAWPKPGELSRQSRPTATSLWPRPRKNVPMARPRISTAASSRSWPTMPRMSYSLKIFGLMSKPPSFSATDISVSLLLSARYFKAAGLFPASPALPIWRRRA